MTCASCSKIYKAMAQTPAQYKDRLRLLRRFVANIVQIDDLYVVAKGSSIELLTETRHDMLRGARVGLLCELELMDKDEPGYEELNAMKQQLIDHSPFSGKE